MNVFETKEGILLALDSIRANKFRSFLTILGVMIGVSSVIAMVALIEGLNSAVANDIEQMGSNVIYIMKYPPEMNHNELVGWRKADPTLGVIFLRNNYDHPRNELRIELTKEVVSHYAGTTIELYSKGHSLIERSLYLVHLLDYASVYLADLNKVDAVEVKVIDFLKNELSKELRNSKVIISTNGIIAT